MKNLLRIVKDPENILSYGLGFVVIWFGIHEISNPLDWAVFAPSFLGDWIWISSIVVIHGIILAGCALLLFLNIRRDIVSIILIILFLEIIITLITQTWFSDIAVRDIGLCMMAVGIVLSVYKNKT